MRINKKQNIDKTKAYLFDNLKKENAFWSYDPDSVSINIIDDDQLIAMTMRYLDLQEIDLLFKIYPYNKIKNAWRKILVPEGEYLYTLNRFFSWYYFKSKHPDAYLKSLLTRHYNSMFA